MKMKLWPFMDAASDGDAGGGLLGETSTGSAEVVKDDGGEPEGAQPQAGQPAQPEPAKPEAQTGESAKTSEWPEDWRQKYAGDNEKVLKRLERYSSPQAALDALISAQDKLSKGLAASGALKDDATPEEVEKWRTDNGIPAKPEEYDTSLPDGLVIGESDKPIVDGFLNAAHASNMTPKQVKESLAWYYAEQDRQREEMHAKDVSIKAEGIDKLRESWGQDYKRNIAIADSFLEGAPEGLKQRIIGGRLADGSPMSHDPQFLDYIVNLSRELNPVASVMPGSTGNAMQAIESEIASMEKRMGEDSRGWHKDTKAQQRYMELITARDKKR